MRLKKEWIAPIAAVGGLALAYACFRLWKQHAGASKDDSESAELFAQSPTSPATTAPASSSSRNVTTARDESKAETAEALLRMFSKPSSSLSAPSDKKQQQASGPNDFVVTNLEAKFSRPAPLPEADWQRAIDAVIALMPHYGGKVPRHLRPGYVDKKKNKTGAGVAEEPNSDDEYEDYEEGEEENDAASNGSYQTQLSLELDIAEQMCFSVRDDIMNIAPYVEQEQIYLASGQKFPPAFQKFIKQELEGVSPTRRWLEMVLEYLDMMGEQRKLQARLEEQEKNMTVEELLKRQTARATRRQQMMMEDDEDGEYDAMEVNPNYVGRHYAGDHVPDDAVARRPLMPTTSTAAQRFGDYDGGDLDGDDEDADADDAHLFSRQRTAEKRVNAAEMWAKFQEMQAASGMGASGGPMSGAMMALNGGVMDFRGQSGEEEEWEDEDDDDDGGYDETMDLYGIGDADEDEEDYRQHRAYRRGQYGEMNDDDEADEELWYGDEEEEEEEEFDPEKHMFLNQHFHDMLLSNIFQVHARHYRPEGASEGKEDASDDVVEKVVVEEKAATKKKGGRKNDKKQPKKGKAAKKGKDADDEWVDY